MSAERHPNLFENGHTSREVYEAMQEHYARDGRAIRWWDLAFMGCAIGAVLISHRMEWLWLFGGALAIANRICCFIDNSNRNWAMHLIDWHAHGGSQADELADPAPMEQTAR